MKIQVKRIAKKDTYTIGKLYINGKYYCDTLEDKDRGLDSKMPITNINAIKIKSKTAIPTGTYKVTLDIQSPKYSNFTKYSFAKSCNGKIPRLLNVPGYEGVLIHPGNTSDDTDGCILVGENKEVGKLVNSRATWMELYRILSTDKDNISIEII